MTWGSFYRQSYNGHTDRGIRVQDAMYERHMQTGSDRLLDGIKRELLASQHRRQL